MPTISFEQYKKIHYGSQYLLLEPDGKVLNLEDSPPKSIYPGSFNPLHDGHLSIINHSNSVCELSIIHPHKGILSYEELLTRLDQFKWKCSVAVTCLPFFFDKCKYFSKLTTDFRINIGYDVGTYLIDMHSIEQIESWKTKFIIYPRKIKGVKYQLKNDNLPNNFIFANEDFIPIEISSSEIRNKNGLYK